MGLGLDVYMGFFQPVCIYMFTRVPDGEQGTGMVRTFLPRFTRRGLLLVR
jgi:hypothetical protein